MRRLRPNLVIGGIQGLEERTWPGSTIRIGEVLIAMADPRGRCVIAPGRDPTGCVGQITVLAPPLTVNPVIRQYFSLRPEFGKQIGSL